MQIEQEAACTVHKAPTHLTKSYATCIQIEKNPITLVTHELCSLVTLQSVAFM